MNRVLFVQGAAERGGAERVLLTLARNLPDHGWTPVVAFLADGPFVAEVQAAGIETIALAARARVRQPWRARAVVHDITSAVARSGATVVHANGEKMGVFSSWAARSAQVPCVVWLHDAPVRSASGTAVQAVLRAGPTANFVTCSEWVAREFRRRWHVEARAIPNGIDFDAQATPPAPVRDELGWPATAPVITHVGRLQQWKGADVFLRAAAQVAPNHPGARFLVVGGALYGWETRYAASLPALARALGIDDRVHFTGHRPDALALMAASDIVVHSSVRAEPFGLVVAEAMALGRAVVASRTGGPDEIVADGESGLLTAPGDERALADALDGLLTDPARRAALGAAGRARVETAFSGATMAARFASYYSTIAPAGALR